MAHEYIEMRTKWKGQDALYQEMDPISSNMFSSVIRRNSSDDDRPTNVVNRYLCSIHIYFLTSWNFHLIFFFSKTTPLIPKPRRIHQPLLNHDIINNSLSSPSSSSSSSYDMITFILFIIVVVMGITIWWCYSEDLYKLYMIFANDNSVAIKFQWSIWVWREEF